MIKKLTTCLAIATLASCTPANSSGDGGDYTPPTMVEGTSPYKASHYKAIDLSDYPDLFQDCPDCPKMKWVTSENDTCPSFAVSFFEISNSEFYDCMDEPSCPSKTGFYLGEPLEAASGESFEDAIAYVRHLSKKTGLPYRLPTVDEWFQALGHERGQPLSLELEEVLVRSHTEDHPAVGTVGGYELDAVAGHMQHGFGNAWEWTSTCAPDGCEKRALVGGSRVMTREEIAETPVKFAEIDRDSVYFGVRVVRDRTDADPC